MPAPALQARFEEVWASHSVSLPDDDKALVLEFIRLVIQILGRSDLSSSESGLWSADYRPISI